jgi:hypothetical protein
MKVNAKTHDDEAERVIKRASKHKVGKSPLVPERSEVLSALGTIGLIDGDSLLLLALSTVDWSFGGQFCHLVEVVERFLLLLVRRGVSVHVIFPPEGQKIWGCVHSLLLARRVLRQHLQCMCPQFVTTLLNSLAALPSELEARGLFPHWCLICDARQLRRAHKDPFENLVLAERVVVHFHVLRKMACKRLGVGVVFAPDIEFRGNDMVAWVLPSSLRSSETNQWPGKYEFYCRDEAEPVIASYSDTNELESLVIRTLANCQSDGFSVGTCNAILDSFRFCRSSSLALRLVEDVKASEDVLRMIDRFCELIYPFASPLMIDIVDGRLIHYFVSHGEGPNQLIEEVDCGSRPPLPSGANSNGDSHLTPFRHHAHSVKKLDLTAADRDKRIKEANGRMVSQQASIPSPASSNSHLTRKEKEAVERNEKRYERRRAVLSKERGKSGIASSRARLADSLQGLGFKQEHIAVTKQRSKKEVKEQQKAATRKAQAMAASGGSTEDRLTKQNVESWKSFFKAQKSVSFDDAVEFVSKHEFSLTAQLVVYSDVLDSELAAKRKGDDRFLALSRLLQLQQELSSVTEATSLVAECARKLRFHDLACQIECPNQILPADAEWCQVQLSRLSADLPRQKGVADPRVPFSPDPWQVRLLDAVDRKQSTVVVAPTSAGKTFVQYYAMAQVLRGDDDGLCVYVCPTKALCHQVLAGVDAFFTKSYANSSRVVAGRFL